MRLVRQERLTGEDPPEYWAVLNEAVWQSKWRPAAGRCHHVTASAEVVPPNPGSTRTQVSGRFRILTSPNPASGRHPSANHSQALLSAQLRLPKYREPRKRQPDTEGIETSKTKISSSIAFRR